MTVVEMPSGAQMTERWLGGRFRLDERISLDDQVSGVRAAPRGRRAAFLCGRPPTSCSAVPSRSTCCPAGPVPRAVIDAVQSAAKVSDPRLATIYDTDFDEQCPYIVTEWTPGTHLEDLVLSGPSAALPRPWPPR